MSADVGTGKGPSQSVCRGKNKKIISCRPAFSIYLKISYVTMLLIMQNNYAIFSLDVSLIILLQSAIFVTNYFLTECKHFW